MSFKESLLEIFWIVKTCLTTFWFWLPILIGLYVIVEVYMFVLINPLSILVLPAIISVYAVLIEDKRAKARYPEIGGKPRNAIRPPGIGSEFSSNWNATERVEEYLRVLEKKEEEDKS